MRKHLDPTHEYGRLECVLSAQADISAQARYYNNIIM